MANSSERPAEWVVLMNPVAGSQKGHDEWVEISRLLDYYNITRQHYFTEYLQHSINLIQDFLGMGYRKFIMAGGDGLLNEAVNAIFTQSAVDPKLVTLAIIPRGTGNDWARTFNIPCDPEAAIQIIRNGKTLRHDIGRVFYHVQRKEECRYFINMCGMGFDAEVNKKVGADRESGHLGPMKYRYHIFTTLMGYSPTQVTLTVDGKRFHHEAFSMALGIGQYNGGGMKQLPYAVPDDGVLDITIIQKITRLKVIRSINRLYDGSFVKLPEVSTYTGKNILIESDPKCSIEADGEALGESPFRFEILPQALNVIVT